MCLFCSLHATTEASDESELMADSLAELAKMAMAEDEVIGLDGDCADEGM